MTTTPNVNEPDNLSDDPIPVDFNDMPEQQGLRQPMLQPGTYEFALPDKIEPKDFEQYQVTSLGPRLRLNLRDAKALKVVTRGGQPFGTQLNNAEMERGRKGGEQKKGSDMAWLIAAVGGALPPGAGNRSYRDELLKHGGKRFIADAVVSGRCNPDRDIYKAGEEKKGVKGCGTKFAMDGPFTIKNGPNAGKTVYGIPRGEDGSWPEGVACPKCGADVRLFVNLSNFRQAK